MGAPSVAQRSLPLLMLSCCILGSTTLQKYGCTGGKDIPNFSTAPASLLKSLKNHIDSNWAEVPLATSATLFLAVMLLLGFFVCVCRPPVGDVIDVCWLAVR